MPEIKNLFTSGRMNKDLDERIIPNNQYRDALNIQVSSSEGSDVGAIENILGNMLVDDPNSLLSSIPSDAKTIGTIKFGRTNCIYWFIASDTLNAIIEYDQSANLLSPVIVDKNNVLNFSKSKLITGINIIDNLLFFTDNNSEPKCINIETFKEASNLTSNGLNNHTEIYSRDFIEQDVTVIKKAPLTAPQVEVKDSKREGIGTGVNFVTQNKNFTQLIDSGPDFESLPAGTEFTVNFNSMPNWQEGDIITWSTDASIEYDAFFVSTSVVSANSSFNFTFKVLTIPDNLPNVVLLWKLALKEEEPFFEKTFARFAYRWLYKNNEYSTFSPFSNVAFFPSYFKYLSSDGFNQGMINNTRYIRVYGLQTPPPDVKEIEILFKDTVSNNVYAVDTVALDNPEIEIESELIHKVIESNQILRPWDNVPRKALAQEISGNRIIYGNYLQNYNITGNLSTNFYVNSLNHPNDDLAKESVKSLRTYQLGVVWKDEYGRETPVFTDSNATLKIGGSSADKINKLAAKITSNPPSFATHFKYFIKETSNPYYNLALDKYYFAEDGNIWLSFPSSERNKVDEETYLYLKKKHDVSKKSDDIAKYKVIDISNEAPEFIATETRAIARAECDLHASNRPGRDVVAFTFSGPTAEENIDFSKAFQAPNKLKIVEKTSSASGGQSTVIYDIKNGGPTGTVSGGRAEYKVELKEVINSDGEWLSNIAAGDQSKVIEIIVYENKVERNSEFEGRFFVKINRDATINSEIVENFGTATPEYVIVNSTLVYYTIPFPADRGSGTSGAGWRDNKADSWSRTRGGWLNRGMLPGSDTFNVGYSAFGGLHSVSGESIPLIDRYLTRIGTKFRFKDKNTGNLSEIYTVKDFKVSTERRFSKNAADNVGANWRKQVIVTMDRSFEFGLDIGDGTDNNSWDFIEVLEERFAEDNNILSSSNPAVFETEPKESVELDIYYEASDAIPVNLASNEHELSWFNCYSFGNGVESDRINDDFNAPTIGKGVKVSAVLDEPYAEERRETGLIFSQIFNSTSGINRLNQFIQALPITKDLNPIYGSIQKLHTRDTDLITLCEDKCLKILANKDALFNADGNANVTSNNNVLGQAVPFAGEYGISKNPESFASYGFRMFFADKSRGVVLRLSRDGIQDISAQGMSDYFNDKLAIENEIIGSYDDYSGCYNISFSDETVSYKQGLQGWPTRKSFVPEAGVSLNNVYYTFKQGKIWSHNNEIRNNFYGTQYKSTVKLIFNTNPSKIKNFKTLSYEGSEGWTTPNITTDLQNGKVLSYIPKEGIYYNFIKGVENTWDNNLQNGTLDTSEFSTQGIDILGSITGDVAQTTFTLTIKENND